MGDMLNNKYYVYMYLDIRKSGEWRYQSHILHYQPFYVGKGCRNRYKDHLIAAYSNKSDDRKSRIIRKIKNELGVDPIILKIAENLSEVEATLLEIDLILTFGRLDLGTGILCNHTDGGDGLKNPSTETKNKLSIFQKQAWREDIEFREKMIKSIRNPSRCKKISDALSNRPKSEEHLNKIRNLPQNKKGYKHTSESSLKKSIKMKEIWKNDKDYIVRQKAAQSLVMTSESYRNKMSLLKKGDPRNKTMLGKKHSEETKAKISAASRGKVVSDVTKSKMREVALKLWEKRRLDKIKEE